MVITVSEKTHRSSGQQGTMKYGLYLIYNLTSEIELEMIDVETGRIEIIGIGDGIISGLSEEDLENNKYTATVYAVREAGARFGFSILGAV